MEHGTHSMYVHGKCRCSPCKQARKAAAAKHYAKTRVRILEQKADYYERNRDEILQRKREWYFKNLDKVANYRAEYREKNGDFLRSRDRQRTQRERDVRRERARDYYARTGPNQSHRRMQEVTKSVAKRNRQKWTPEEDAAVMADSPTAVYELAFNLERSYESVIRRRLLLRKKAMQ